MTTEATDRPHGASRTAEARLARLHLRTGMLSLARAKLETMAADGTLDTPALADLAEARWRSGDLPGAGDAAVAHLDAGGAEPVALIVAAEGLAARGRTNEARGYANRLLAMLPAGTADPLEPLFAGQPRSAAWPATDVEVGEAAAAGMIGFATEPRPAVPHVTRSRSSRRPSLPATGAGSASPRHHPARRGGTGPARPLARRPSHRDGRSDGGRRSRPAARQR